MGGGESLRLENGSRVGIVGGGPAGSFSAYFLLQMAARAGQKIRVRIYEPRDYSAAGPASCNMCGGIVSESLLQSLSAEGMRLPPAVVQKRIDSYFLHMDVGSVRIDTPLQEKRIAAVYRGGGPKGGVGPALTSFDGHLLDLAAGLGAEVVKERVAEVDRDGDRPRVKTRSGGTDTFDLLVGAVGVNTGAGLFEGLGLDYRPPKTTGTYIGEFHLGRETVQRYFGNSMHVFLLDLPRLEFAAIIPKGSYATVCLLGENVDKELVETFLDSPVVRECFPPHWQQPDRFCHCSPRINVAGGVPPFADRFVFVGDCGVTRLFKDGIGAAYRTAKAAAVAAVFEGISADAFRRRYFPTCTRMQRDNGLGKLVFAVTRQIQHRTFARRALWRMVSAEQSKEGTKRRMSTVLWDTFTGSAPYSSILGRTLHPAFQIRLLREAAAAAVLGDRRGRPGRVRMATGVSGLLGKKFAPGEVVYHQGERGHCMYVVQGGEVEVIQRRGDKEFCLATLGDGDFFGEMALFQEEVRSATVRAVTECHVFTLERESLLRRIHEDPSLAFRIIEKMSRRIQDLEGALMRQANTPSG